MFDAPVPFILGTTFHPRPDEISSQAIVLVIQQSMLSSTLFAESATLLRASTGTNPAPFRAVKSGFTPPPPARKTLHASTKTSKSYMTSNSRVNKRAVVSDIDEVMQLENLTRPLISGFSSYFTQLPEVCVCVILYVYDAYCTTPYVVT